MIDTNTLGELILTNCNFLVTDRSTVSMSIRVIQYAPSHQAHGRQPCTVVRRDFVLSPGDLEMELTLDKQV